MADITPSQLLAADPLAYAKIDWDAPTQCWLWTGYRGTTGYARILRASRAQSAHRYIFQLFAVIPDGLELDHLCRVRHCVNPAHLEPVTHAVNVARGDMKRPQSWKSHCIRGHELTGDNLRWYQRATLAGTPLIVRQCRKCDPIRKKQRLERRASGVMEEAA